MSVKVAINGMGRIGRPILKLVVSRPTSVDEVNRIFIEEAATERYAAVLGVTHDPLVASDILRDSRASVVDLALTRVIGGDLVKVMSWYDNEWGYATQVAREALSLPKRGRRRRLNRHRRAGRQRRVHLGAE